MDNPKISNKRKEHQTSIIPGECPPTKKSVIRSAKDISDIIEIRIRSLRFQSILASGILAEACDKKFSDQPMDNSISWLGPSKPNIVKVWAEIKTKARINGEISDEFTQMVDLFNLLIKTGAKKFLNEIDPNDNKRPIDVASKCSLYILVDKSSTENIDFNPTTTEFPLHRVISTLNFIGIKIMIDQIDRDQLDWVNPTTGKTTLCTLLNEYQDPEYTDDRHKIIEYLLSRFVGAISPRHRCFNNHSITGTKSLEYLRIACFNWDEYKTIHLPSEIDASINGSLLTELITMIVDYAC